MVNRPIAQLQFSAPLSKGAVGTTDWGIKDAVSEADWGLSSNDDNFDDYFNVTQYKAAPRSAPRHPTQLKDQSGTLILWS